jgi:flagellar biosynthesis protein FlhF
MKISRFTGATVADALARVKSTLGSEAVILETCEADGVVTITAAVDHAPLRAGDDAALVSEVRSLMDAVRELVDCHGPRDERELAPELRRLQRALLAQGVDGVIAATLVRATAERVAESVALDAALAETLAPACGGEASNSARVRLVVGPPGDGKTTTVAKFAARERRLGRRVALITTDTYRVGAQAELETYGRALGVPVVTARDARALKRALHEAREAECVLVDTAGVTPGMPAQLAELRGLVDAAGPECVRTLVVSGTTGGWAAERIWEAFAPLEPRGAIVTKLDTAPGGPVVGVLWRRGVPVSHVAAGRRIAQDLEAATPVRLARCLLAA